MADDDSLQPNAWNALAMPTRVGFALLVPITTVSVVGLTLSNKADSAGALTEAAYVLRSLSTAAFNINLLLIPLSAALVLLSIPSNGKEAIARRLAKQDGVGSAELYEKALRLKSLDELIQQRESDLEEYERFKGLQEAGVQDLIDDYEASKKGGVKQTWIVGMIGFAFAIILFVAGIYVTLQNAGGGK